MSCEMAGSKEAEVPSTVAISGGLTPNQIAGLVKKAAALDAKFILYTNTIPDPDEVLWVASLDSCCVFVAVSLKLRVFYSSIVSIVL